jgi:hypothetical protein
MLLCKSGVHACLLFDLRAVQFLRIGDNTTLLYVDKELLSLNIMKWNEKYNLTEEFDTSQ